MGAPVQPRFGLSAVLPVANVTLKLRGAYGRAIRAPGIGYAEGFSGPSGAQLAHPLLRPERQRGWEGGVDLIFGTRGSLSLTGYDQNADDLITQIITSISSSFTTTLYRNVGRVRNRGLEVEGTLNLRPVQVRAQYAYGDSRIEDLGSAEGTGLTVGGRPNLSPAHTGGATLTAAPWILDKSPLEDIRNSTSSRYVMKNGRLYQSEDLTEIWPRHKPLPSFYLWDTDRSDSTRTPQAQHH